MNYKPDFLIGSLRDYVTRQKSTLKNYSKTEESRLHKENYAFKRQVLENHFISELKLFEAFYTQAMEYRILLTLDHPKHITEYFNNSLEKKKCQMDEILKKMSHQRPGRIQLQDESVSHLKTMVIEKMFEMQNALLNKSDPSRKMSRLLQEQENEFEIQIESLRSQIYELQNKQKCYTLTIEDLQNTETNHKIQISNLEKRLECYEKQYPELKNFKQTKELRNSASETSQNSKKTESEKVENVKMSGESTDRKTSQTSFKSKTFDKEEIETANVNEAQCCC
jgi:hypothetical protein